MVQVQYANGKYDIVKPWFLDWLIESRRIVAFKRGREWAIIGRDPVRSTCGDSSAYGGRERRGSMPVPPLAVLMKRMDQGRF